MARRTKEDALATRNAILDAAEQLFVEQGVSRTTLQHIAAAAGVTRGAVYWHFEDKIALYYALMDRATMPVEVAMQALDASDGSDPLADLLAYAVDVFRLTVDDPKARRAFEIATLKIEYVDDLAGLRERKSLHRVQWITRAERLVRLGVRHGQLQASVKPGAVALGLYVLIEGLVRNWLIQPDFNLVKMGSEIVSMHLACLRR